MKQSTLVTLALTSLTVAQDSSISDPIISSSEGSIPTPIILPSITDFPTPSLSSIPFYTGSITNHFPYNTSSSISSASSEVGCTYVTAQGEPVFTIQTDTSINTGCTYTVYPGMPTPGSSSVPVASGPGSYNMTTTLPANGGLTTTTSKVVPSSSSAGQGQSSPSTSTTGAATPPAQTDAAGRLSLGSAGLAVAVVGGVMAWL